MPNDAQAGLISTADLLEKSFRRFGSVFSSLFPWLVISCIGGLLLMLSNQFIVSFTIWTLLLSIIGVCILFLSYLAAVRIISGVEKEPKDIITNGRSSLRLFLPYIWITILEVFIFLGGVILILPALIFTVYIAVAPYVLVVENVRGMKALSRSWTYVSGHWWAVLWRLIVFMFLVMLALFLGGIILGLILTPAALSVGGIMNGSSPAQLPLGIVLIQQIIDAFFILPIAFCFLYELYADLIRVKPLSAADSSGEAKTATLWLNVFLIIGLVLALIWVFFAGGHAVASAAGFRYHFARH